MIFRRSARGRAVCLGLCDCLHRFFSCSMRSNTPSTSYALNYLPGRHRLYAERVDVAKRRTHTRPLLHVSTGTSPASCSCRYRIVLSNTISRTSCVICPARRSGAACVLCNRAIRRARGLPDGKIRSKARRVLPHRMSHSAAYRECLSLKDVEIHAKFPVRRGVNATRWECRRTVKAWIIAAINTLKV